MIMKYRFTLTVLFISVFNISLNTNLIAGSRNFNKHLKNLVIIGKVKKQSKQPPGKTCLHFLRWYVSELRWFESHHFFQIAPSKDTITPHSVNYTNLKKYKLKLKQQGDVSDEFLQNIQMQYDSAANYLRKNPQNDGPILGFENDPVIQLQESDMLTQHIKSIRLKSVRFEYGFCYVTVKVSRDLSYVFVLSNQKKKWLIDSVLPRFER